MVSVCVDPGFFTVDGEGRLGIKHDCSLQVVAGGLSVAGQVAFGIISMSDAADTIIPVASTPQVLSAAVTHTLVNPSSCRTMLVQVHMSTQANLTVEEGSTVVLYLSQSVDGAAYVHYEVARYGAHADTGSVTDWGAGGRHDVVRFLYVAPGGSMTVSQRLSGKAGGVTSTLTDVALYLNMMGVLV